MQSFSTEAQYMTNIYEPLVYATPLGAEEDFEPGLATVGIEAVTAVTSLEFAIIPLFLLMGSLQFCRS